VCRIVEKMKNDLKEGLDDIFGIYKNEWGDQ